MFVEFFVPKYIHFTETSVLFLNESSYKIDLRFYVGLSRHVIYTPGTQWSWTRNGNFKLRPYIAPRRVNCKKENRIKGILDDRL